jgi:outer membrane lipoprotein carrier protein
MRRTFIFLLICYASQVSAQTIQAQVRALEDRYHRARTLKANFYEKYSDGKGTFVAESGVVYFSRPGRMRWDYQSPEQKLFLVDGNSAWFYIPADRTASRAKMKDSSDWRTPLAFLAGKADLSKLCAKVETSTEKPLTAGDALLQCIPRGSDESAVRGGEYVLLETDPTAHLVRVTIHEPGNTETEFRFGNWQENIPIPEVQFHFQPPKDVTIVDEESLLTGIH